MRFSVAPLLIHSDAVPAEARDALLAASDASLEDKTRALELAARVIYHETDLDCQDARELVGLSSGCCV
jgi:hypothetical protein